MDVERTVRSYYGYVDEENYEDLFSLFADDVIYHRPGTEPLEGMEAFRRFYLEDRPIERGTHSVDTVYRDGDAAVVKGHFEGILEGDQVSFGFVDVHQFDDDGNIEKRWTYTDLGSV